MKHGSNAGVLARYGAGLVLLGLLAAACSGGGGGGPPTGSDPVTRVEVTGGASVQVAQTLQLSAAAFTARGPATGKTPSWSSSDPGVAQVSATGLVTGVSPGAAVISARVDAVTGQTTVTVTPVPVASVTLARDTATLVAGGALRLTATARDGAGAGIPSAVIAWTTLDPAVAGVAQDGTVTALGAGAARIVAASGGRSDTAAVTVVARTAATVRFGSPFVSANPGATPLSLTVLTAEGLPVPAPVVSWSAPDGGTIQPNGTFSSAAAGRYRVAASVDGAVDTTVVAVLGPASILVTAWPGAEIRADGAFGRPVSVPVVVDMTRVSAIGDLGSFQVELAYDASLLELASHTAGAAGTLDVNGDTPGTVRVAFAHTAVQGAPRITVVTLVFHVKEGAPLGARQAFGLLAPVRPSGTGFTLFEPVVAVGGQLRVVAP